MNKEVIYLEPEDDITDILTKLQQAEQKLVALVPPKKGTMLRSAVNMKLVARVSKECEKVVVIVTADPAIVKMAMAARIPVAKTLQSRPVVPTEENFKAAEQELQMIDEELVEVSEEKLSKHDKSAKVASKMAPEATSEAPDARSGLSAATFELDEESLERASEEPKKGKKLHSKAQKSKKLPSETNNKLQKWLMIGIPVGVILIVALVWAFVFAPAATITVAVSSTASNFSETVNFTTELGSENLAEGTFFAEKQTIEQKYTTTVEPTGEEDHGDKATGRITARVTFIPFDHTGTGYYLTIDEGDRFITASGLEFIATSSASTGWDGESTTVVCDNGTLATASDLKRSCNMSVTVPVEAAAAGADYNISAGTPWNSFQGISVSNGTQMTGGTTDMVKVISQEDVDKVRDAQIAEHTIEGRENLFEDLSKELVPIESSFAAEPGSVESKPAVGEALTSDSATGEVTITAVYSVYTVEKSKIDEYIKQKTELNDDQRIYSTGNPYFERFTSIEEPARLKSVVETGPIVTEDAIFEQAKGRKTGEVQSALKSIDGVSSVEIRTSYFWVWSIPRDRNKVTIDLTVEGAES